MTSNFQKTINFLYRHPKGRFKQIKGFGGYFAYKRMLAAHDAMRVKSFTLPPVQSFKDGLPLYFLTGKNYLHQTLFCIASLYKYSGQRFKYHIVDDGTLDTGIVQEKLPGSVLVSVTEIETNLKTMLPRSDYPAIHKKRSAYAHLKKLTDIHTLQGDDHKMVLDSDMLFWAEPKELIAWLKKPSGNLFMTDSTQSYGYSTALMEQLCGAALPVQLNVGVAGIRSSSINWFQIEKWISALEEKEGASYYLEQALTAMIAAKTEFSLLSPKKYIVYPSVEQTAGASGILHHYVDYSKKQYFLDAWKKFA